MTVPYDVMSDVLTVLTRISSGKVPTVACDEQGLSYNTFVTYCKRYPHLAQMRIEAEDRLYDQMAEALPQIYDHPIYGTNDPKMAGVVSANIKWLLARRRRDAYGEHSTVEHKITADREVLDALQKAKARAQGFIDTTGIVTNVIEGEILIDAPARETLMSDEDLSDLY
jgi:hypothetical protein